SRAVPEAERAIGRILRAQHRVAADAQPDFDVQHAASFLALRQQTVATLGRLTAAIGALAVIVGGTGILALMLLSVKERAGEIGLRMAVGARPRDIVIQFLFEATLLASAGWMTGIALAAGGAGLVIRTTGWKIDVPSEACLVSLGMAMTIGLGFG